MVSLPVTGSIVSETVKLTSELPMNLYNAIEFILQFDEYEDVNDYLVRAVRGGLEAEVDCGGIVENWSRRKMKEVLKLE
jgi:hypothetical protein